MYMNNNKSVLVICPDVPFPDNYGGALDMWKSILYLKEMGFLVHLVSIYRDESRLKEFEASEQYKFIDLHIGIKCGKGLMLKTLYYPLAMSIRSIKKFDLQRLAEKLLPQYTYALVQNSKSMLAFADMQKFLNIEFHQSYVRMQNCEWEYYGYMASAEKNLIKKVFFLSESVKFKYFEKKLLKNNIVDKLLFISERDKKFYGSSNKALSVLPVFLNASKQELEFDNKKNILLFVGNLELADNVLAVEALYKYLREWLLSNPDCKLIIAGKNKSEINPFPSFDAKNVEIFFNIPHQQKKELMDSAKVFCSFSMNPAGVKLKTLEGGAAGLPILANNNACDGSGLEDVVMNIERQSKDIIYSKLDTLMVNEENFKVTSLSVAQSYKTLVSEASRAYEEIFP